MPRDRGGRVTTFKVDQDKPLYRDAARAVDDRVEDLLARMTPEEKVAQLGSHWVFELADAGGELVPARAHRLEHGIGHVTRIAGASSFRPEEAAELANAIQRHLIDNTRLGIPAIVDEEICSGLMARDSTIFPQAIGLASTWEPTLVEALADTIRTQMRAGGMHQGLGPVLDVCRDPRWGRLEETFGEDPYLVARMGVAFVRGLQGDDLRTGVVATVKHLVGYGASEGGMNWAPPHIGARELRDVHLHPFEAAVRSAGVRSVMNAYNELDGIPCAADRTLLTTILRDQWGFDGCVVSDYFSIRQLLDAHQFAVDEQDAAVKALVAGMDVELPSTDCYGEPLLDAVVTGLVATDTLDGAVRRVLRTKFELGLFENPFVDTSMTDGVSDTVAHRELARIDRAEEPRARTERRHAAACAGRGLSGGHRPLRRERAQSLRRLRISRSRRVDSRRVGERPGHRLGRALRPREQHRRTRGSDRAPCAARAPRRTRSLRTGLRRQLRRTQRLRCRRRACRRLGRARSW